MVDKVCVVFVCNDNYYGKFRNTCNALLTIGNYTGDITLIIGDDLYNKETQQFKFHDPFIINNKINIKYFPDYKFSTDFLQQQRALPRNGYWFDKLFQYHKMNLFDTYFKQWDYIFYIDCGMNIFSDITPILNERKKHTMIANRDGVDFETAEWCIPETPGKGLKIGDQFIKTDPVYESLKNNFDMKERCFQTTTMLYSTSIITDTTKQELYDLLFRYPISMTNDQGIISLYFTQIKPCWEQLRRKDDNIYYYDLVRCVNAPYIMVKYMGNGCINVGYE